MRPKKEVLILSDNQEDLDQLKYLIRIRSPFYFSIKAVDRSEKPSVIIVCHRSTLPIRKTIVTLDPDQKVPVLFIAYGDPPAEFPVPVACYLKNPKPVEILEAIRNLVSGSVA